MNPSKSKSTFTPDILILQNNQSLVVVDDKGQVVDQVLCIFANINYIAFTASLIKV